MYTYASQAGTGTVTTGAPSKFAFVNCSYALSVNSKGKRPWIKSMATDEKLLLHGVSAEVGRISNGNSDFVRICIKIIKIDIIHILETKPEISQK